MKTKHEVLFYEIYKIVVNINDDEADIQYINLKTNKKFKLDISKKYYCQNLVTFETLFEKTRGTKILNYYEFIREIIFGMIEFNAYYEIHEKNSKNICEMIVRVHEQKIDEIIYSAHEIKLILQL